MLFSEVKRAAWLRYGGAVAIIAVAALLRFWLDQPLAGGGFMIFFAAVIIASWFGGLGPSLLALVLTLVISGSLFEPNTPPDPPLRAMVGLSLFFFTGLSMAALSESQRAARRRAEAADRRKDEFLAILAHELRNPLAPISMGLDLLRQPGVEATNTKWVYEVMGRQVQHLTRLVDDLLDVSRITRGKIELRREPTDLQAVVARALEAGRGLVESKGHELTVELPDEPVRLTADPIRLSQVIANLLNNAAKFTPPGGKIRIRGRRLDDEAEISVRDTGIGIAPDMLSQVFELFTQAPPVQGGQGGLGIGLTLVKSLLELMGGSVEARSEGLNKGSEFVVRLPLTPVDEPPANAQRTAASGNSGGESRRIFVVDDNADAAHTLTELLRLAGHQVQTFHDGRSALAAAPVAAPEVVLLDLGMPEMDGLEVARRLRRVPSTAQSLLIAVTGWGQAADRERTQSAGFDHHLVKPVDSRVLRELLTTKSNSTASRGSPDWPGGESLASPA
ncbi:MAG TPA: ATP-binding protein [Pirellulales bacterium]|nr:ATP-binding protein [Pirellulales bacterium]